MIAILSLIVWMFIKKDKNISDKEKITANEELVVDKKEAIKEEFVESEKGESASNKEYEIIESEDGFFRVRKFGSERTIRKFISRDEANDFVNKKEIKK